MSKTITFSGEAREKLIKGVNTVANAVGETLGPRGRNVLIQKQYGSPHITKDGVTVAKEIVLEDAIENLGATILKDVASKSADIAGDGTTTATVLTQAIINEANKSIIAGVNPMEIKRGIDKAAKVAVELITKNSKHINGDDDLKKIATISANGDEQLAGIIAKAFADVGKDGIVTVEQSDTTETTLESVTGMQFDRGYISQYFVNNPERMRCEMNNCHIMVANERITNIEALVPVIDAIVQGGKELLIIAEDVEGAALSTLVVNRIKNPGMVKVCAVKAPGYGDRRIELLHDIAILTDAIVCDVDSGTSYIDSNVQLGFAKNVVVTREYTTISGGKGSKEAVEARVKSLQAQRDDVMSDYDREKIDQRIAKLTGGVAAIKVGGMSDLEMKERRDRVDDAVAATRAAIKEGYVVGGGVALLRAASVMSFDLAKDAVLFGALTEDEHIGANILVKAMRSPLRKIIENAGASSDVVINKILENSNVNFGYNAATEEYCDLIEDGVIDPTLVVVSALNNAASMASLLVTTQVVITETPKPQCDHNHQ